ncbi:MAG TPA: tRNA lysidine(34) synthetase TilS, partial [Chitinophagales bacterium]
MALVEVFHQAKLQFEIAHCNFQLRGKEADEDENFARELAKKYEVDFHVKKFETAKYAEEKKLSIQQAARELRYDWFEKIRAERKLDLIATAHHADDQVETILYQFIKGTGVRGLRGMKAKRNRIIRPMSFAGKAEILQYLEEQKLSFRTDSSNAETKYARNKIRLELLPLIEQINPSFKETILTQRNVYEELELLYNRTIAKDRKQLFIEKGSEIYIPILKLKKSKNAQTLLYEFLKEYGFNKEQVSSIFAAFGSISGKQFLSQTHRVIKDRTFLILSEKSNQEFSQQLIEANEIPTKIVLPNAEITISKS